MGGRHHDGMCVCAALYLCVCPCDTNHSIFSVQEINASPGGSHRHSNECLCVSVCVRFHVISVCDTADSQSAATASLCYAEPCSVKEWQSVNY